MIATGKAAEYVTEFEEFKAEMEKKFPEIKAEIKPLTEDDQINLFKITSAFELDETFRSYIMGCFFLYGKARIKGKGTLLSLIKTLSILDSALDK